MKKNVSNLFWGIVFFLFSLIALLVLISMSIDFLGSREKFCLFIIITLAFWSGSLIGTYFTPQHGQYDFKQIADDKKFKVERITFGFGPEAKFGGMVILIERVGRYTICGVPKELFKDGQPEVERFYLKRNEKELILIDEKQ